MTRRVVQISDELAALDELEREIRRPPKRNLTVIVPIVVTLIVAVGATTIAWYSYTTGVREGSEGAAPLLKPQGPVKVTPETPGGLSIPHQDKTVFQAIEGRRTDTRIERLLPPPESPAPLPARAPKPATRESKSRQAERLEAPVEERDAASGAVQLTPGAGSAKSGAAMPKAKAGDPPTFVMPVPVKPAIAGKKPSAPEKTTKTARIPPPKAAPTRPQSGYGVQIGSLSSKTKADRYWNTQSDRYKKLLGGLSLIVQTVTVKGKTYHRVQGGTLKSQKAASDLCGKLKKRGVGCVIVRFGK
jgi:cell division septation protein DedD